MSEAEKRAKLDELYERYYDAALALGIVEEQIEWARASMCGRSDESVDVESFTDTLGVTRAFVDAHEAPVGQLHWFGDLPARFSGSGNSPGSVNDQPWGTGALISPSLFLTAGHLFDATGGSYARPRRNHRVISAQEMASLMFVRFKFQIDGATGKPRVPRRFPVLTLREYREKWVDYAIVELGRDETGELPGDVYQWLDVSDSDVTTPGTPLCVIQHPHQSVKKVEVGVVLANKQGSIRYNDIDTFAGSSGAPIIGPAGTIVGVHTQGGCTSDGGANGGTAIGVIREVSTIL